MKKILFSLMALSCLMLFMVGCSVGIYYNVGVGSLQDTNYAFTDFNTVAVSSNFEYDITQSDKYSVVVTTHQNLVEYLDVNQSGQTVTVRFKPGSYSHTDAKVVVTMPELNKLTVSGASRGTVTGFKSNNPFDLKVSGASQLDMNIEAGKSVINVSGASRVTGNLKAQDASLLVSGASRCELDGVAESAKVEVSGASQVQMPNLEVVNASVTASGASHVTVNTRGTLDLEVSGASILDYLGKPILSKVNVTGASKIFSR